jgi:hypothetical protein
MAHIIIGNIQANQKRRGSFTIPLEILEEDGAVAALITNAIPDPGAEVSVCGKDVMEASGYPKVSWQLHRSIWLWQTARRHCCLLDNGI